MSSGTPWFWMKCAWMSFLGWVQHFFFSLLFNGKHVCIKSLLIHKFQRHERGLAVSIYCDISKANIHRGNTDFGIKECVLQPNNNYIQHNVQTMKSFSITAVWIWHNRQWVRIHIMLGRRWQGTVVAETENTVQSISSFILSRWMLGFYLEEVSFEEAPTLDLLLTIANQQLDLVTVMSSTRKCANTATNFCASVVMIRPQLFLWSWNCLPLQAGNDLQNRISKQYFQPMLLHF